MKFTTTAALAAFGGVAIAAKDERTFAVLRFTNKFLTKGSVDPLVTPGEVSTHSHQVMGGSNFGLNSTGEDLMNSKCTNALIKGDNSNYWFPKLYFNDEENGKFEEVEVDYFNAYYFFEPTNDEIKAFPPGLGMFSGDPMTRTAPKGGASNNLNPNDGPVQPIIWTCPRLGGNTEANLPWPEDSDGTKAGMVTTNLGEGVGFPSVDCDGFGSPLRADIHFPSCYDPSKDLLDYKNNMAWPEPKDGGKNDCPKGWIHVPHLFYEVYWQTPDFAKRWPSNGKQPFVLSNGDATGYSLHADFMAGWDEDVLQNIIDNCNAGTRGMDNCPGITVNTEDCTIPNPAGKEECTGTISKLPGNNPLSGWSYGSAPSGGSGNSGSGNSGSGNSGSGSDKSDEDSDKGSDKGSDSDESPAETPEKTPEQPKDEYDSVPDAPADLPTATTESASKPTIEVPADFANNIGLKDPEEPKDDSAEKPQTPKGPKKPKTCKRSKSKKAKKAKKAKKTKRESDSTGGSAATRASSAAIKARQHAHEHQQGVRRHSHGHHH